MLCISLINEVSKMLKTVKYVSSRECSPEIQMEKPGRRSKDSAVMLLEGHTEMVSE